MYKVANMGWRFAIVVSTWVVTGSAFAQPSRGQVVDRAVALVDGRVITLSELEFEARVFLVQSFGEQKATAPLDDEALRVALDLAIARRLEASEADKLQAYPLEEGELEAARRAFEKRFTHPKDFQRFLQRHEVDLQQLAAVLERGLRADKILESKLKLRAQVSEAEVKRFYDEHAAKLTGSSYDELRASLRQKLVGERLRALTLAEFAEIRKGADVRLIAPFARGAGGAK